MRVAKEKALPFEPLTPNAETIEAMKAARRGALVTVGKPGTTTRQPECGGLNTSAWLAFLTIESRKRRHDCTRRKGGAPRLDLPLCVLESSGFASFYISLWTILKRRALNFHWPPTFSYSSS